MRFVVDSIFAQMASPVIATANTVLSLSEGVTWYQVNIPGSVASLSFDVSASGLTSSVENPVYTFYLKLEMPTTPATISWNNRIKFLDDMLPIVNAGDKTYLFMFTSFDLGNTWIAAQTGSFNTPQTA